MEKNDKLKQYQSLAIQLRQVVPSIQQLYHEQAAFLSTLNVQNVLSVDVKKTTDSNFKSLFSYSVLYTDGTGGAVCSTVYLSRALCGSTRRVLFTRHCVFSG